MQGLHIESNKFWKLYHQEFGAYGVVTQGTVDGLNYLLERFETESRLDNIPQFACVTATAFHESGKLIDHNGKRVLQRFQPVREAKASVNSEVWIRYQSKYWHTGFFGRGLAQTTFEPNYQKVGQLCGVGDLFVRQPDLLLEIKWSYKSLVAAMVFGIYRKDKKTGRRCDLDRFFPDDSATFDDYYNSREIINGDKNLKRKGAHDTIGYEFAVICMKFEEIFRAAQAPARVVVPALAGSEEISDDEINDLFSTGFPDDPATDVSTAANPSVFPSDQTSADSPSVSAFVPPEQQQSPPPEALSGNANSNAPADAPGNEAPPAQETKFLNVEDWKPWVFSSLKRVWAGFTGFNFTQSTANLVGAVKSGDYWWLMALVAVAIIVITFIVAALVSLVLLAIWYLNRKEIGQAKINEAISLLDPATPNLKVQVEKIWAKPGLASLLRVIPVPTIDWHG